MNLEKNIFCNNTLNNYTYKLITQIEGMALQQ